MLRVGLMAIEIEGNKIALTRWIDEKKRNEIMEISGKIDVK